MLDAEQVAADAAFGSELYTLLAVAMMAPLAPDALPNTGPSCDICNHVSGIIEARNALRIAYNAFLNQRRVAARSRQPFPDDVAAHDAGPDEQALSREAMQLLARAVGRLPGEFRAALLLRIEQGLSFREIADVLDTTEQTARWRVFKARQKLMTVLAPQLDREKP